MDYCDSPIFHTLLECLRASKETATSVEFQARRANRHWVLTEMSRLFLQLHDSTVLARLKIQASTTAAKIRDEERTRADDFFRLTVCTASIRAWHMLWYSESCPEQLAGILCADAAEAAQAMGKARDTAFLVLGAEQAAKDETHNDRVDS